MVMASLRTSMGSFNGSPIPLPPWRSTIRRPTSRQSQDPWMESTDTLSEIFGLSRVRQLIRRWHQVISSRLQSR